jgi:hypothetical protein
MTRLKGLVLLALGAVYAAPTDCAERAVACRAEVRAAPPTVARGTTSEPPPGEPVDLVERAIWACVRR